MRASLLWIIVLVLVGSATADVASAETEYHSTGYGKTYQSHPNDDCYWWDPYIPGGSPCKQGIWSETVLYNSGHTARVVEYAEVHDFACYDYYGVS